MPTPSFPHPTAHCISPTPTTETPYKMLAEIAPPSAPCEVTQTTDTITHIPNPNPNSTSTDTTTPDASMLHTKPYHEIMTIHGIIHSDPYHIGPACPGNYLGAPKGSKKVFLCIHRTSLPQHHKYGAWIR